MSERRVRAVDMSSCYKTECVVCGKPIELYFNGGELDERQCCGVSYSLEAPTIDFVIRGGPEQTMDVPDPRRTSWLAP